jgi:hypothetical protein
MKIHSRHLLGTGREKEALAALCYINGLPENDPVVQEALDELAVAIRAENEVCNQENAERYLAFMDSTGREGDMA